jgi:hypothetical protein
MLPRPRFAAQVRSVPLSGEDPYLLCIVLSDLKLVHLRIDPVASSVREDFEEVVERVVRVSTEFEVLLLNVVAAR